jgi:hypothetical protein
METSSSTLLVLTLGAVAALLVYGLPDAWRYALRKAPLPLLGMIRQGGVSPGEAQSVLGREALSGAAQRCAHCANGSWCAELVKAGMAAPIDCPNKPLLDELRRPRAAA